MDKQKMLNIADAALSAAKAAGATAAKCIVIRSRNEKITMREGKITAYSPKTTFSVVLAVFSGVRRATVKCLQDNPEAFADVAKEAMALAEFSGAHEFDGVPGPEYWPCASEDFDILAAGLQNVEKLPPPSFGELHAYAETLHNLGVSKPGVIRAEVHIGSSRSEKVLATSAGFSSYKEGTSWRAYIEVVGDDDGEVIAGGEGTTSYSRMAMRPFEELATIAHERMLSRKGAVRPKSGRIPVIIDHDVAPRVIDALLDAMNVDAFYRKRTFLAEHIGKQCFAPCLTITDMPHIKRSQYAALVDADGVATSTRMLVDDGVPTGWIGGYEECRKIGIVPTGHAGGAVEIFVQPGELSFSELCGKFPRVLVVTAFNGRGFDAETGDVSVGVEGYILEGGAREVVHEAVIAGTMLEMFSSCILANDADPDGPIHAPSMYVGEMKLSGV